MAPVSISIYGIALDAPASTKCHCSRVPPGELLTSFTIDPNSRVDRRSTEIRLFIYRYLSKSRCFSKSYTSYDSRQKSVSERGGDSYDRKLKKAQEHGNKSNGIPRGKNGCTLHPTNQSRHILRGRAVVVSQNDYRYEDLRPRLLLKEVQCT